MSLAETLRNRILAHGPIPFREFMEKALYDPAGGYYASGRATIGRRGDFYTSVSVGPIFGRLLARQFIEMWERLGSPNQFVIIEQGAHGGQFAYDVLEAIERHAPRLFANLQYGIVEPTAELRRVQQRHLAKFAAKLAWHNSVAALPEFTGVHFSNELLDAFPVIRAEWDGAAWREQLVTWTDGAFRFVRSENALPAHFVEAAPAPARAGYVIEFNPAASAWICELTARLKRGWILAIDYGYPRSIYFRPERTGGTLSAYAGHQRVDDPLAEPGSVDLTAHVDFTALAEAAEAAGLTTCGFLDQHHLMVGLSRLHFADQAESLDEETQKELRGFRTLMHPEMMGTSFKAICFGQSTPDGRLSGFEFGGDPRAMLELT